MQNRNKAKSIGRLSGRAKRVLAVLAVFILTMSFGASALADGGRGNGAPSGAPAGGQQTPGVTGGQQPENGNGEQNGNPSREAMGANLDKIEAAIATIEDETVQASLTALLETYADALEAKLKQEKARKQLIEARKRAAESKLKRSQDTRRKILVGAAILGKVERGEWPREKLLALLDATLTRADDRALFDLQEPVTEPAFLDSNEPGEPPSRITLPRS